MDERKSRAWREVDLDALAHNARALQAALAPGCRLMAVVKADAYGHGALPVARRLEREGVGALPWPAWMRGAPCAGPESAGAS